MTERSPLKSHVNGNVRLFGAPEIFPWVEENLCATGEMQVDSPPGLQHGDEPAPQDDLPST